MQNIDPESQAPRPESRAPSPRFLIPNPQSPIPSRSGISLIEVLVSIVVLLGGLVAVAMLIPIGKLSMIETEKADRTGACGRAALHDVKVRRMLDYSKWLNENGKTFTSDAAAVGPDVILANNIPPIVAIDPLGRASALGVTPLGGTGGIPRYTFWTTSYAAPMITQLAEPIFVWHDDLMFQLPEDVKSSSATSLGTRPMGMFVQADSSVTCPAVDSSTVTSAPAFNGSFSWFLTVVPQFSNGYPSGLYNVSVVVCHKRLYTITGTQPDAERVTNGVTCVDASPGGTTVTCTGSDIVSGNVAGTLPLKNDEWVLLCSTAANGQCSWYRVVHAGYDGADSHISLVGPDWNGGTAATIVLIDGVTGVYTRTMQLDQ